MNINFQLSANEARIVESILAPLSARARYPLSLERLLQRWSNFVAEVANGYEDSIYEYTNDLSTRDILEAVVQQAPPPLRDRLSEVLHPIDRRFIDATNAVQRSLGSSQYP